MNIKIDINNCRVCLQTGRGQPLFGDTVNQYDKKYTYITQLPVSPSSAKTGVLLYPNQIV